MIHSILFTTLTVLILATSGANLSSKSESKANSQTTEFKADIEERSEAVVEALGKIRTAERQLKAATGEFTSDWDVLIEFMLTGKNKFIYKHADVNDSVAYHQTKLTWEKANPGKKF